MKNIATKNIVSLLIVATIATPTASVYGQSTEITGTSGGSQASTGCGFLPTEPDYSFKVTQSTASISITVSGNNDYTLLMVGPDNSSRECILAHDFDGGAIQSRGLYKTGTYHLYVGDIDGVSSPFTIIVDQ
ncbi:MAG: hypothetical protein F6K31_18640 [Symploca sp. SIO2G7]|nr:hypothetical protein [Symploca sp. SIO2G7]